MLARVKRVYGLSFHKLCLLQRKLLRPPLARARTRQSSALLVLIHQLQQNKNGNNKSHFRFYGGQGWIRTTVVSQRQIYSLLPLATRAPTHVWCIKFSVFVWIYSVGAPTGGSLQNLSLKNDTQSFFCGPSAFGLTRAPTHVRFIKFSYFSLKIALDEN